MFVAPTSNREAPLRAMMSGTRKLPPISTSSPREMATFLPHPTTDSMSSTAAALLLTTSAPSAPVREQSSRETAVCLLPRVPSSTLYSRVDQRSAAAAAAIAALWLRGARPRLVWSTTPVPLMTGRRVGRFI